MILRRFIVRMKNAAIKNYNIQMELVKTFKKDWKEMQDASAPMPDPPDYEPPVMTIKNARKLPWSTLWLILSEAITLYKMTLFNREEAMKIIEEEEAVHEARRIYRIKMRNKDSSKDLENETFQFHKNMPLEISEMIEKLKTTNPKLYQEALQIKDVKGAFAFMREHKGASSDQLKAVATDRMELMGDCIGEFMTHYKEGKEKGYKEASADDKYLQNIVSPFYHVMTAKVDEIVDDKKVGKNNEKNNPKKNSFFDEFAKLKERFNASVADADADYNTKMNKNMTNTSSSSSLKRRQSSMNNRKNEDNENLPRVMENYIDTFLASRDVKLTPIELEKKKRILKDRIAMRDRNILKVFNAADKVENFVSTYTNGSENITVKSDLNRKNDILNNENNDELNVEESQLKNKLNQILNTSSRNEILNKLNGNDRSINKNNENVVRHLDRGTSVFLTLEDEFFKFKKEHYDVYDPEKEIREKNNDILISQKTNIRKGFQNNRILSTAELNEIYAKESLQNKKITSELKNKGKETVYSYTDYLLSRSKSFLPFYFDKNAQVLTNKNDKKSLRSNNRK